MHEIILIERNSSNYKTWPGLMKKKKIPELSVEEIVDKYQGIEGYLIEHFLVENDVQDYKKKASNFPKFEKLNNHFLYHIISNQITPDYLKKHFVQEGYDVGFCDGETLAIFSSIFHEILFGFHAELIAYKDKLNGSLLFPNRDIAEEYVQLHDKMSAQGKDVEDIVTMQIYEVWKHTD